MLLQAEATLLQCVEEGNFGYQEISEKLRKFSGYLSDTGDSLRDGKNSVIVFAALCSRAAVRGGMPAQTSRELETDYLNRIEACRTIPQLAQLRIRMLEDFIERVWQIKDTPQISTAIRRGCDFIRANITRDFTLSEVAAQVGYSDYYFAKKIHKEMGIRINDFIKEVRIDHARILLVTTDRGIDDISDSLHFGNRNYFTRVFREVTGTSPAAYREQVRKDGET